MNDTLSHLARAGRVNNTTSAMLVVLAHSTKRKSSTVESGSYLLGLGLIMRIRPRASAYEYRILAKIRTRFTEGVSPSRADGRWRQIGIDRLGGVVGSLRKPDAGLRQPRWQRRFVRAVHVLKEKSFCFIFAFHIRVWCFYGLGESRRVHVGALGSAVACKAQG